MILLLDTSTPECRLTFLNDKSRLDYNWQSDRNLAKGLLKFVYDKLTENAMTWSDISAIGVFKGPGSFTGLRIGLTVMNTIADSMKISIVGGVGDDWQNQIIDKIKSGGNDRIVLPFYGSEANITSPRK